MNQAPLPEVYGAPLRLRVENPFGYKMVKWIERIEFVTRKKPLAKGKAVRMRMMNTLTSCPTFEAPFPDALAVTI
jgi:DMSO/TMAO reductase YedYZ molybdopterin-dependent catalytic subunit